MLKLPFKIVWTETGRIPATINIKQLANGYLVGNIFYSDKEDLIRGVIEHLKDPYADFEPPYYASQNS